MEYSKKAKTRTKTVPDQYSSGKYNTRAWWKLCHHLQRNIRCSWFSPWFSARKFHHRLFVWWGKYPSPEQGRAFSVTFGNKPLVTIQFCAREDHLLSQPLQNSIKSNTSTGEGNTLALQQLFHPTNTNGKKSHSTGSKQLNAQNHRVLLSHKHMQSHIPQHTCLQGGRKPEGCYWNQD